MVCPLVVVANGLSSGQMDICWVDPLPVDAVERDTHRAPSSSAGLSWRDGLCSNSAPAQGFSPIGVPHDHSSSARRTDAKDCQEWK